MDTMDTKKRRTRKRGKDGILNLKLFVSIHVHSWFAFLLFVFGSLAVAAEPDFGPNVLIFDPRTPGIQQRLDAIFARQERAQFGSARYAYLFMPGEYHLDVRIGFYMQANGLGRLPDAVRIVGAVRSTAEWMHGNATCNFWRCAENLLITPIDEDHMDVWAVSQGTALRRMHIHGNLNLWDHGWSSGGFMADSKIDRQINSGSQQQWLSRNDEWNHWRGGSYNMVFVGSTNPPSGDWPERPYTVIDRTPLMREKPYLFVDASNRYFVMVPELRKGSQGTTWSGGTTNGRAISLDQFYLAHSDQDTAANINAALSAGKNLLLTPGIYHLDNPLHINRPNTIVLGLGYPTLIPINGTPAMTVSDVDGIELGGVLLDAGPKNSPTLLQVGSVSGEASHADNSIFLYDIYCRAGGATVGMADSFVTINSNNVVGDNFWLWRADHGAGARWNQNKNRNGLIVNGNDVTLYGLFVEHCQEYQTIWNGKGGRVYFYQSEMPYDPPSQEAWSHDGVRGYASYKVGDGVKMHEAWGLGIYCVFRGGPIIADRAIETPTTASIKMHHMVTVRFNGVPGSGIEHVINNRGGAVISQHEARVDNGD
jgi:hypothetical protein